MAVLKTSFRFPEINLGFVTSARGAGHLTPKKSLGRGAFDQRKGPHGEEFDQKKCPGVSQGGWGAWAPLDLTHTLPADHKWLHSSVVRASAPASQRSWV